MQSFYWSVLTSSNHLPPSLMAKPQSWLNPALPSQHSTEQLNMAGKTHSLADWSFMPPNNPTALPKSVCASTLPDDHFTHSPLSNTQHLLPQFLSQIVFLFPTLLRKLKRAEENCRLLPKHLATHIHVYSYSLPSIQWLEMNFHCFKRHLFQLCIRSYLPLTFSSTSTLSLMYFSFSWSVSSA